MKANPKQDDRYAIIMAGGRGERFWPLSRTQTPKQLLPLLGKRSLLQQTVERVLPLIPWKNILVITNAAQATGIRRQLPKLPKDNLIVEPVGRDTCAAVTLGAAIAGARSPTATMAVLPADHYLPDPADFQRVLADALDLARRGRVIVTIGIRPTEPATGYGYIRIGDPLPPPEEAGAYATTFFKAEQFVEKPNYDKALEYLESGHYRWNAGMFIWSFVTLTEGLEQHVPEMADACQRWFKAAGTPRLPRLLAKDYPQLKKISVDYALMEKSRNTVVASGNFLWDDLGSWTALARHLPADEGGNCAQGEVILVDASRNIIFDARKTRRTVIGVVGLRDSIIVQTDDATLVAHKSQAQKVKDLVAKLGADKKYKKLV